MGAAILASTFLFGAAVGGVIPAHIFYLKFFEETELAIRFGAAYRDYKGRVGARRVGGSAYPPP